MFEFGANEPAGHGVHDEDATDENVPGGQVMQLIVLASHLVPAVQATQPPDPLGVYPNWQHADFP